MGTYEIKAINTTSSTIKADDGKPRSDEIARSKMDSFNSLDFVEEINNEQQDQYGTGKERTT